MSKSIRQQFADTLLAVGGEDEKLVVIVGDISHGILQPYARAYPNRYYNIGILEPTQISIGAGVAATGMYPVLHTIAPFLIERAFEHIKLDFCYHKLAGNIVTVGSAFEYSNLGCTHHCYNDFALMKTLQGTEICVAASGIEFDALFRQTYSNDKLTVTRMCGKEHGVAFTASDIVFGQAIKVADGQDVTLIATGPQLKTALLAREQLASQGKSADILYVHTIRPLDTEAVLASVTKTRNVVVIEEHMRSGGLGDDVLRATYQVQDLKFSSVSIPDTFLMGYGSYEELCISAGITVEEVINAARN